MNTLPDEAAEVLSYWLGDLDAHGLAAPPVRDRWWSKDPALDEEIRRRFEPLYRRLGANVPASWDVARARLAAVIVWDQFSRNMHRGTARMFATDPLALSLAGEMVEAGQDEELATHERMFAYMPFMHSERIEDQRRCVELFTRLRDRLQGPAKEAIDHNLGFAVRHRDIVERFGRFPHRNAVLERESTAAEREFLAQPGSSF